MSTYRSWYLSLAAFLLVAGPSPALAQKEPPLKMLFAVWKDTAVAAHTMQHMNKKAYDLVEAYAVLVKDSTGKVEVGQRHNQAGGSPRAMQASVTIDTAIARLSALPANAGDSVSAYAPNNGPASLLSEKDFKKVVTMFGPRESAVLLISPQPNVAEMERFLGMGGHGAPEFVEVELKQSK